MQKWDYKVVKLDPSDESRLNAEAHLQQYGDAGWELVAAVPCVKGPGQITNEIRYILKRPKQ